MITMRASLVLGVAALLMTGCATQQAQHKLNEFERRIAANDAAWQESQERLINMCKPVPTEEEYRAAKESGSLARFKGCDLRVTKVGNGAELDDWVVGWLPPYSTIVRVHEEDLRRRSTLAPYEEYMFAIARYLAKRADAGEISPEQLVGATNAAWAWLIEETAREGNLLESNLRAAQAGGGATAFAQLSSQAARVTSTALAGENASGQAGDVQCEAVPTYNKRGKLTSVRVACW